MNFSHVKRVVTNTPFWFVIRENGTTLGTTNISNHFLRLRFIFTIRFISSRTKKCNRSGSNAKVGIWTKPEFRQRRQRIRQDHVAIMADYPGFSNIRVPGKAVVWDNNHFTATDVRTALPTVPGAIAPLFP